jgi:acyl-CoA dehydrogenase
LPALGTACGHMASRTVSAYAYVRKQFGMSIGKFEGVQEAMARIGGLTYQLEGARRMTAGSLDLGQAPAIVTAISKYHMTEMARQIMDDSMDIHAGRAIQLGPKNYTGYAYMGIPVAITVEGANILTRNLMIFGQGATRCHPYVFGEMEAAADPDSERGLEKFDGLLMKHLAFGAGNFFGALGQGLTLGRFNSAPVGGETARYYQQLSRMSKGLALCADISMLMLGGDLKRKEMISARLGDVLSHLYLASSTLKHYEDQGRMVSDLPFVQYALERNLHLIGKAFDGFFQNFPNKVVGALLKRVVFPFGIHYQMPADDRCHSICQAMMKPGEFRDRLTALCYVGKDEQDAVGQMERAFLAMVAVQPLEKKIAQAQKEKRLPRKLAIADLVSSALAQSILTQAEADQLLAADALRYEAIQVDNFAPGELESMGQAARVDDAA